MAVKEWALWQKIVGIIVIVFVSLWLILAIGIWVVFPLVFMNSLSIQRFFMFFNVQQPKNPEFDNPEKYDMHGVVNFYLTTKDEDTSSLVSIGAWLILHEDDIASTTFRPHSNTIATEILQKTKRPILIYLHGVACNRIMPFKTYQVLRKHFVIVAPDHRGFGDSGPDVVPSESGIVNDTVQLYSWIRTHSRNEIFVWGHSLGAALAIHTVKRLKKRDIIPMGLVLESAFSTMRDEVAGNSLTKWFAWLPYFEITVQRPLERNGFLFKSTTNILFVDCPTMHLHAEDDAAISHKLGETLFNVANTQRNLNFQGDSRFHLFPAEKGYNHVGITSDPQIPNHIEKFVARCRNQRKMRG